MSVKKTLVERLDAGETIIGDGGMLLNLERRGYVHAGNFTPEVVIEHPDAVRELHREFALSGCDVLQPLTFYANSINLKKAGINLTSQEISDAACNIAREVAGESHRDIMIAGSLSETMAYAGSGSREAVENELETQVQTFIKNDVDFVIAEYFRYVEEICWAIECLKKTKKPVVAMMNIGGMGDRTGISTADCALKMAEAGADVIGLNCCFDPEQLVEAVKTMKAALESSGYKKHLICQPLGCWTPDAGKDGYIGLPEFPFALEPRFLTRFDMRKYARNAYEAGIRYIGGCCFFEAFHIREIVDELSQELQRKPPNAAKMEPWGTSVRILETPWIKQRGKREYWENLQPATGRIYSPPMAKSQHDEHWRSSKNLPR